MLKNDRSLIVGKTETRLTDILLEFEHISIICALLHFEPRKRIQGLNIDVLWFCLQVKMRFRSDSAVPVVEATHPLKYERDKNISTSS